MREAEKASGLCPITDIRISIGEAAYDDYTQVPLTDTLTLVYTKELVNSKPITTTSVEYEPCLNSRKYSRDPDSEYYILDRDGS